MKNNKNNNKNGKNSYKKKIWKNPQFWVTYREKKVPTHLLYGQNGPFSMFLSFKRMLNDRFICWKCSGTLKSTKLVFFVVYLWLTNMTCQTTKIIEFIFDDLLDSRFIYTYIHVRLKFSVTCVNSCIFLFLVEIYNLFLLTLFFSACGQLTWWYIWWKCSRIA